MTIKRIGLISAISGIPTIYPFVGYGGIERIVADLSHAFQNMGIETIVVGATGTNAGDTNIELPDENLVDRLDADVVFDFSHRKLYPFDKYSIPFWSDAVGRNPIFPTFAVRWAMFGDPSMPVIYPGIDTESIIKSTTSRERRDYVYVGRIAPYKGVDTLLHLMRRFDINIEFYGHVGQYSNPAYATMVDEQLTEMGRNRIHRNPTNQEMYDALSGARAFLFMADWSMLGYNIPRPVESFGITAVESLACGTPVYTNGFISGVREIIDSDFGVVLPWDITEWKDDRKFNEDRLRQRAGDFSSDMYASYLLQYVGGYHEHR